MKKKDIEFVVTIRCKICGDIVSLSVPLSFNDAVAAIDEFEDEHKHARPNPWQI